MPNSVAEHRTTVDVAGAVSVTAGLIVLVYAIVKAQEWGWGSADTLALGAVAAALLAAFVWIESHTRAPLIRLSIFRVRSLAASNASMLLVTSGMYAMFFFSSLYVQQILGFAQNTGDRPQMVQSKHLVRELLSVMRQTFPRNIDIEERLEGDLWLLEMNPTHLHQLLLNLCVNARDAMPAGGKLFFGVRNQQIDAATAANTPDLQPGTRPP